MTIVDLRIINNDDNDEKSINEILKEFSDAGKKKDAQKIKEAYAYVSEYEKNHPDGVLFVNGVMADSDNHRCTESEHKCYLQYRKCKDFINMILKKQSRKSASAAEALKKELENAKGR